MYPRIRTATPDDVPRLLEIARQYRAELGYVHPVALREHIGKRTVLVAEWYGNVWGFVDYHARRDGWQTVYHLAVDKHMRGQGIGRQLLYAVPCPMRLKVTQDNPANVFYAGAGMQLASTEAGKKRPLNVYELRVLGIFCMGNGKADTYPRVARESGLAYGTRSSEQARAWPYMLDVDWKQFNAGKLTWDAYMQMVREYHPVQAMCVDYERPSQRRALYAQIRDLRNAGVLRVLVCPKFSGAVAHIPSWCIVAVSVPSTYAGYVPDGAELTGRRVHLLGGSPHAQRRWMLRLQGAGAKVVSFDGNSHEKKAQQMGWFDGAQWRVTGEQKTAPYESLCIDSGRNILRMMNTLYEVKQLALKGIA